MDLMGSRATATGPNRDQLLQRHKAHSGDLLCQSPADRSTAAGTPAARHAPRVMPLASL